MEDAPGVVWRTDGGMREGWLASGGNVRNAGEMWVLCGAHELTFGPTH